MCRFAFALVLISALFTFCPGTRAEVKYAVTDLGTLGGTRSNATAINSAGDVVGGSGPVGTTGVVGQHAFLYRNGVITDLGIPFGDMSIAAAINSAGQVVIDSSDGGTTRSFLYVNGTVAAIGGTGFQTTVATDINESGQVVGIASSSNSSGVFVYENGQLSLLDLSSLGANSLNAHAINNQSQIVGTFEVPDPVPGLHPSHGFLYSNGTAQDLGEGVGALSINDAGDIVGRYVNVSGGSGAFLFRNGQLTIIGGGTATDINS